MIQTIIPVVGVPRSSADTSGTATAISSQGQWLQASSKPASCSRRAIARRSRRRPSCTASSVADAAPATATNRLGRGARRDRFWRGGGAGGSSSGVPPDIPPEGGLVGVAAGSGFIGPAAP